MRAAIHNPRKLFRTGHLFFLGRKFNRAAFAPPETLKSIQDLLVRQMTRHAYETVPFYRSLMQRKNLKPTDFHSARDLRQLPIISKREIVKHPDHFISSNHRKSDCVELRTSGTMGMPTSFFHCQQALLMNVAYGFREKAVENNLTLKNGHARELFFRQPTSSFLKVTRFYDKHLLRLNQRRMIASTANSLSYNVDLLNDYKPDILSASGSYLGALLRHAIETHRNNHLPKLSIYCSDALHERDRELVENDLHMVVRSVYRTAECLKIGFMCEKGEGFHLHSDICPLYLIDEEGNPAQSGEIVVSNLLNPAMVLLNYRIGDLAKIDPNPCKCGRTLPRIKSLQGRIEEIIRIPGKITVEPHLLKGVFSKHRGIERYQIIQKRPLLFLIKIIPKATADKVSIEDHVRRELECILTHHAQVEIAFIKQFENAGIEKFQTIRSWRQGHNEPVE